jgi:hypothetical protein
MGSAPPGCHRRMRQVDSEQRAKMVRVYGMCTLEEVGSKSCLFVRSELLRPGSLPLNNIPS